MDKVKVQSACGAGGGLLWAVGWIFSIGFLHLSFWEGVLAIVIWPYYLGSFIRTLI